MTKKEQSMRLYQAVERLALQAGEDTDETIDWLCGEHGGMAKLFEKYFSQTPPAAQRQWVGLDADEKLRVRLAVGYSQFMTAGEYAEKVQDATEDKLREKNGGAA
jgi:hypothetical protein